MTRTSNIAMGLARAAVITTVIAGVFACGQPGNLADCEEGQSGIPCSERTPDEEARLALKDNDYDRAIEVLEIAIPEDPENYGRYCLLAAVYAAKAGVNIVAIATSNLAGGGSSSLALQDESGGDGGGDDGGILGTMGSFVPTPADFPDEASFLVALEYLESAVATLNAIPEALRSEASTETYASSAILQLTLYQTAYSVMYLNQFTISATTGEFDPAELQDMTEEDALVVLSSLANAAAAQGDSELGAQINEALAEIESAEGGSNRDRLVEFLSEGEDGGP